MKPQSMSRCRLASLPLILLAVVAGCDSLLDTTEDLADNAYVYVTGASPVPLQLILSNDYTAIENDEGRFDVTLAVADTLYLSPPFQRTHPIGGKGRIFVRLTQPDSTTEATVQMRITLDDQEVYNVGATLREASLEYLFVYF